MKREDVHYEDSAANNPSLVGNSLVPTTDLRKSRKKIQGQSLLLYAVKNGRRVLYAAMKIR